MVVALHRGKTLDHVLGRPLRENGHPVVALLSVDGAIVAEAFEKLRGKALVGGLDLLQTDDIGRGLGEPVLDGIEPRLHRIDVPGGDFHAAD